MMKPRHDVIFSKPNQILQILEAQQLFQFLEAQSLCTKLRSLSTLHFFETYFFFGGTRTRFVGASFWSPAQQHFFVEAEAKKMARS